jgi:hypothetical protein
VYLNNDKPQEALGIYQRILKEEPGYAPALVSMASYYQKTGQDSLYRMQLDTILLNDNVLSERSREDKAIVISLKFGSIFFSYFVQCLQSKAFV